jgi:hypothetical protein
VMSDREAGLASADDDDVMVPGGHRGHQIEA